MMLMREKPLSDSTPENKTKSSSFYRCGFMARGKTGDG
jgi:hypothetical protein